MKEVLTYDKFADQMDNCTFPTFVYITRRNDEAEIIYWSDIDCSDAERAATPVFTLRVGDPTGALGPLDA